MPNITSGTQYEDKYRSFLTENSQLEEWVQEIDEDSSDNKIFTIDVTQLYMFDEDLVQEPEKGLVHNPRKHIESIESLLDEMTPKDKKNIQIRFSDAPTWMQTSIRELREEHIGRLLFLEGSVSKATDVRPKISTAVYECKECGSHVNTTVSGEELSGAPSESLCPNATRGDDHNSRTKMDLLIPQSKMSDYQKLRLQEPPQEAGGDNPKSVDVHVTGSDMVGVALAGRTIQVNGVMEVRQPDDNMAVLEKSIDCLGISSAETDTSELEPTDTEEEEILDLSQDEEVYNLIGQSIAPSLYGYDEERKGVALQQFKGVRKEFSNSSDIRGDIHVLLVGDPGTGKSRILKYCADLAPDGGIFASGKSASSAGLTATATKDKEFGGNDKWTLKAGALVLANDSVACVDELDKMSDEDRSSLHEALEQQQISVAKAGITATLNSRCTLLAAANPIHGRFDEYEPVYDQIDLEPALFSRFDLIYTIQDEIDEDRDSEIAGQILNNNQRGQEYSQLKQQMINQSEYDSTAEIEEELDDEVQEIDAPISRDLLQKYIYYANKNYSPVITDEAKDFLKDQYVKLRGSGGDENVYPETARALEALVRLTEAAAKIRLSNTAEIEHAKTAFSVYAEHKRQVDMDPETGQFDVDKKETGTSASERTIAKALLVTLEELEEQVDTKYVPREDIVDELEKDDFTESEVGKAIEELQQKDLILRKGDSWRLSSQA